MKKVSATLLLISICSSGLHAQGLDLGIKAGVNIANQKLSGDFDPDTKAKIGFHGGVFVTWMFSEKLGLQPEVLFSMQGSKDNEDSYDYSIVSNYLTIPVLVRYDINDMFSVHAGPQFGLLLSAEEEFNGDKDDIKDDFKGTDIGIALGLEADDLPLNLGIGARYIFGVTNVLEEGSSFLDTELKNGVFQIYVKLRLIKGSED